MVGVRACPAACIRLQGALAAGGVATQGTSTAFVVPGRFGPTQGEAHQPSRPPECVPPERPAGRGGRSSAGPRGKHGSAEGWRPVQRSSWATRNVTSARNHPPPPCFGLQRPCPPAHLQPRLDQHGSLHEGHVLAAAAAVDLARHLLVPVQPDLLPHPLPGAPGLVGIAGSACRGGEGGCQAAGPPDVGGQLLPKRSHPTCQGSRFAAPQHALNQPASMAWPGTHRPSLRCAHSSSSCGQHSAVNSSDVGACRGQGGGCVVEGDQASAAAASGVEAGSAAGLSCPAGQVAGCCGRAGRSCGMIGCSGRDGPALALALPGDGTLTLMTLMGCALLYTICRFFPPFNRNRSMKPTCPTWGAAGACACVHVVVHCELGSRP